MTVQRFFTLSATLALVVSLSGCSLVRDLGVGKGFSAKYLCSAVFNSGLEEDVVINQFIKPKVRQLPWFWNVDVDHTLKQVTVGDLFTGSKQAATAIWRQGKGCTLLVDKTREDVLALPFRPLITAPLNPRELWPQGTKMSNSPHPEVDYDALKAAVSGMFAETYDAPIQTTSVAIVHKGELIYESYGLGAEEDSPILGWSMTKTITGMLVGLLADQGRIDLDAPAPLADWAGTEKAQITTRELLNMTSGIENNENYKGLSDVSKMLYLESDQLAFAQSQMLMHEPGTVFDYSTPEANRLAAVVHSVVGDQQAVYDFYQQYLFHKLGIRSAVIEFDAAGGMVGGAYGYMNTQDWARLGLLYLNRGVWNGERIFSEEWMQFALTGTEQAAHYGAQLWINAGGERWADLPEDIFYFMGHQGQRVIMIPSKDLVVVRTGVTENYDVQKPAISDFLHAVYAAVEDTPVKG